MSENFCLYGCFAVLGGAGLGQLCDWGVRVWLKQESPLRRMATNKLLPCRCVQLTSVLLLFSLLLRFHGSWQLGKFMALGCLLLAIGLVDHYTFLIPNSLLLWGLLLYVPLSLPTGNPLWSLLLQGVLNGCAVAVPLLLFVLMFDVLLRQETMGGGDIKLFFLLGVYMGPAWAFLTLFFACLLGLLWQLGKQALRRGTLFPFGPSIAVAAWLVLLWGEPMVNWYWQALL